MALFHNEHQLAILLNTLSVLFSLVQDAVVVALTDTHELTVVHHGAHHAAVVQLLHCWRDTEAETVIRKSVTNGKKYYRM